MARELTLEEQILEHKMKSKPLQTEEEKLTAMFSLIDKNGDGHIELLELQEGLKKMNLSVSEEKVSQMFLLADKNHDGEISFEEFVKFFRPLPKMVELTNILPRDLAQKNVSIPITCSTNNNNSFSGQLTQQNRTRSRRSGSATPDSNNSSMSMENSVTVNPAMTNEETEQALRDLFEAMDTNKSGTIEVSELKDGFRQFGYNISEGRLAQMFAAADKDRNGTIEYQEFCSFFKHLPQLAGMMQNERIKRRSVETHVENESTVPRRPFYRRPPSKSS